MQEMVALSPYITAFQGKTESVSFGVATKIVKNKEERWTSGRSDL